MARTASGVPCTACRNPLRPEQIGTGFLTRCDICDATVMAEAFPALVRGSSAQAGQPVLAEGEASCFYHPTRKAAVPCDNCGRFLCGLCQIQIGRRRLCPACLQAARDPGKARLTGMESSMVLYDDLALMLALVPLGVTPLVSLYLTVRHWSTRCSVAPRSKLRWVLAVVFSLGQIGLVATALIAPWL